MTEKAKEQFVSWLLSQGAVTVILIGVIAFMMHWVNQQVPEHLRTIQDGYMMQEQRFLAALESRDAKLTEALKGIADSHDKDRELFIRLLDLQAGRSIGKSLQDHP